MSVLDFPGMSGPVYRLVYSGSAARIRDKAQPTGLLTALEALARQPRPPHARPPAEDGGRTWSVQLVPGWHAHYSIADRHGYVMIRSIEPTAPGAERSGPSPLR